MNPNDFLKADRERAKALHLNFLHAQKRIGYAHLSGRENEVEKIIEELTYYNMKLRELKAAKRAARIGKVVAFRC